MCFCNVKILETHLRMFVGLLVQNSLTAVQLCYRQMLLPFNESSLTSGDLQ